MKIDTSPAPTSEDDVTADVLRRVDRIAEARPRRILFSLVQHLHHFAKDVRLTGAEWSEIRQEFMFVSDALDVSTVVSFINRTGPPAAQLDDGGPGRWPITDACRAVTTGRSFGADGGKGKGA